MKFLRFSINDDIWNFYIVPSDDETSLDGSDSEAEVNFENKEVHIKENCINRLTINHELWHIHQFYTFLSSADLNKNDMEEVSAELFSHRGEHIIQQGLDLLKQLEALKLEED